MAEPSLPQQPHARGAIIHGFRAAVVDVWGDGALRAVAARLPDAARAQTIDAIVLPVTWVPTSYVIDWHVAVWEGLAGHDDAAFCRFLDRGIDFGFGAFQRMFFKFATPDQVVAKAPELWRRQHTHGVLTLAQRPDHDGTRTVLLSLRDSPMVENPISRRSLAEVWRHVATLARVKHVRETHGLEGGALVAHITWTA